MPLVRELPRFSQPGHCIMFPGRRRDERGFFMFDTVVDGPNGDIHIGISGEGLRTIAARHGREFGIAPRERLDEALADAAAARAEVDSLRERVEALESFKTQLAGVAAEGFEVKRRMGRPLKKED